MFELRPYHNNQLWNPFADMERMMNSDFSSSRDLAAFKTDITDEGDHYELKADLPGFRKEDIHLDLDGDTLRIRAEGRTKTATYRQLLTDKLTLQNLIARFAAYGIREDE